VFFSDSRFRACLDLSFFVIELSKSYQIIIQKHFNCIGLYT
jgi:hypothetical protein